VDGIEAADLGRVEADQGQTVAGIHVPESGDLAVADIDSDFPGRLVAVGKGKRPAVEGEFAAPDGVEIAGADLALVLGGGVAVDLGGELGLLQLE
jgi:hypothetical protein